MQKPFFSIIVVSLNPREELKNTLDSIVKQTFKDVEVILKDGGSRDGSLEKLKEKGYFKKNPGIQVFREKDRGIYDAMNQAVKYANGEFYLFLNCGDYFYDDRVLEKAYENIRERKKSTKALIFYGNLYNRKLESPVCSAPTITEFTLYRNVPCHQVCFYHNSLFEERGYEEQYVVRADYEHFLYCIYKKEAVTSYMDLTIASYEGGGFSETKASRLKSKEEHQKITMKYMGRWACFKYKCILWLTLVPLRTLMAESTVLSEGYNRVKGLIYGMMRRRGK